MKFVLLCLFQIDSKVSMLLNAIVLPKINCLAKTINKHNFWIETLADFGFFLRFIQNK